MPDEAAGRPASFFLHLCRRRFVRFPGSPRRWRPRSRSYRLPRRFELLVRPPTRFGLPRALPAGHSALCKPGFPSPLPAALPQNLALGLPSAHPSAHTPDCPPSRLGVSSGVAASFRRGRPCLRGFPWLPAVQPAGCPACQTFQRIGLPIFGWPHLRGVSPNPASAHASDRAWGFPPAPPSGCVAACVPRVSPRACRGNRVFNDSPVSTNFASPDEPRMNLRFNGNPLVDP